MKKALVLGILAIFALNITNVNAQDKKKKKVQTTETTEIENQQVTTAAPSATTTTLNQAAGKESNKTVGKEVVNTQDNANTGIKKTSAPKQMKPESNKTAGRTVEPKASLSTSKERTTGKEKPQVGVPPTPNKTKEPASTTTKPTSNSTK